MGQLREPGKILKSFLPGETLKRKLQPTGYAESACCCVRQALADGSAGPTNCHFLSLDAQPESRSEMGLKRAENTLHPPRTLLARSFFDRLVISLAWYRCNNNHRPPVGRSIGEEIGPLQAQFAFPIGFHSFPFGFQVHLAKD